VEDFPFGSGQGVALASLALVIAMLTKLRAHGLLSNDEILQMFDSATLLLEEMGVDGPDPKVGETHAVLQSLLPIFSAPYPRK